MNRIKDIREVNRVLAGYMPQVKELIGKDVTLERMKPLMALLGNPQDNLKIIHIAGTSGKTSTAYYTASMLQQSGKKVGLTVSPHIDSITERVQINLKHVSESEFCLRLGAFLKLIERLDQKPTYFELVIAFVYWYFDRQKVDYAVIETGLGGLHDATNVAGKSDKICVITDIGLDHMHVLGHALTEIAEQKAGIIHTGNQVFMYQQSPAVMNVFETITKKQSATLNVLSNFEDASRGVHLSSFGNMPDFQKRNWLLAKTVFDFVAKRDNLPALSNVQLSDSMQVVIPARMDIIQVDGKTLIMDGAHNQQKMDAFLSSFTKLYPDQKADVLLALKTAKKFETVLPLLLPVCSRLIITTFDILQDIPAQSIDPQILSKSASENGFKDVEVVISPKSAYEKLLDSPAQIKIITGSFYLLSCVRPYIIKTND